MISPTSHWVVSIICLIPITIFRILPAVPWNPIPVSSSPVIVLDRWHGLSVLQETLGAGFLEVDTNQQLLTRYRINTDLKETMVKDKDHFKYSDQWHVYRFGVTIPSAKFTLHKKQYTSIYHFKLVLPVEHEWKLPPSSVDCRGHWENQPRPACKAAKPCHIRWAQSLRRFICSSRTCVVQSPALWSIMGQLNIFTNLN